MPRRNLAWLLAVPSLVLLGLAASYSAPAPDKDYRLVRQIVDVLATVDTNYVRELNDEERTKLVDDMIDGGLRQLDPHSEYLTGEHLKAFETNTEGSFGGIGVTLATDPKTTLLKVESPMPGTPAYDAGIAAGDLIVKVGDASTEGMRVEQARKLITGEVGTPVRLTTVREGRQPPELEVTVNRAKIEVHSVTGVRRQADDPGAWDYMVDPANKLGYVRLSTFSAATTQELQAALRQVHAAGGKGLVLDLRDDPGGLLPQAIQVTDQFLAAGKIVGTKNRRGSEKASSAEPAARDLRFAEEWPVAVLVNRGSASASEIVAAALQDHGRAVVVGERTYGKGSVQQLLKVSDDPPAKVKLTTETYWRPSGKNIHRYPNAKETDEWGVKPDAGFEVATTDEDRKRWREHVRESEFVAGKPGTQPPPAPKAKAKDEKKDDKPYKDAVLERALEYLRAKVAGVGLAAPWPPLPA